MKKSYLLALLLCFNSFAFSQVCGQLDTTFNSIDNGNTTLDGFNGGVQSIAVQPDGNILMGGSFSSYHGYTANRIIRLSSNSSIDNTFASGTGFNNGVSAISVQTDGKILVGGNFTSYNGASANHIIRLNTDGSIDNAFASGTGFDGNVYAITIQNDGKILVGGYFTSYNGTSANNNMIRLNTNGSIDNTFASGTGFSDVVAAISVQTDGKILVGGAFTNYNGTAANCIIRLNTDGSIDNTFASGTGFDFNVNAISVQPDGKILVGGNFTNYNGTSANIILRLNTNGSIDNTFASGGGFFWGYVIAISVQTDGKILLVGDFSIFNGTSANSIIRLNTNGSIDNTFVSGTGFSGGVVAISVQTDGKILVGGNFYEYNGTSVNYIIRLNTNGSIDNTFPGGTGFDGDVYAISVQSDGKILVGGDFSSYNGVSSNSIIRLNTNGSIDNTFASGAGFNDLVRAISVQPDGKILVGGDFTNYNGVSANSIIRLNTDGSIDNTFASGTGFDYTVYAISVQTDGKILVGGYFNIYNGTPANRIIRLNTDGSIDNSFASGTGFNWSVYVISVQTDGKILVGGGFNIYNGASANGIIRLNTNGSIDNTFVSGTGFSGGVVAISVQTDGKILVGGYFTSYNGASANNIIRVNTNGSIDNTFASGTGFSDGVEAISVQADGKVLVGGYFTNFNGTSSNKIVRINANGSIDNTFVSGTGFDSHVAAISLQTNGKILVGGDFSNYNGNVKHRLCRLHNASIQTTPLFNSFLCQGTYVNVDYTTAGQFGANNIFTAQLSDAFGSFNTPTAIGSLTSVVSGTINAFIPNGLTPSSNYRIRVVSTNPVTIGTDNGSNLTIAPPINATIAASGNTSICIGSSVNFNTTSIAGASYQWLLNNAPIIGANALSYSANAAGNYSLLVTTFNGCSDTSNVIAVNVITYPSASITYTGEPYTCTGNTIALQANTGTGLTYQWQLNGNNISGATNATYTANAGGSYTVAVTNAGLCSTVSAPVVINPIPTPTEICVCTVDNSSTYNLIVWEKPITTAIDSFRVYREDISNIYTYVASIDYDSLSQYIDIDLANADPNINTKRYKLKTVSICGDTSAFSYYHNTVFLIDQGNGTFNWNLYDIQNSTTPILNYILYRDTTLFNNWDSVANTAGTQNFLTATDYANFPNCRYRIESNFGFTCDPTRAVNVTRSNIKNRGSIGPVMLSEKSMSSVMLFPNPAEKSVTLICEIANLQIIQLMDMRGNLIQTISAQQYQSSKGIIDLSTYAKGVYFVQVMSNHKVETRKLIIQ